MNYFTAVLVIFVVIFSTNSFACEECYNDCELVGEIEIDDKGLCRMRVQNCKKDVQTVSVPAEPGLIAECDGIFNPQEAITAPGGVRATKIRNKSRLPPCRKNGRLVSASEMKSSYYVRCDEDSDGNYYIIGHSREASIADLEGNIIQDNNYFFVQVYNDGPKLIGCPSPSQCVNDTEGDGRAEYNGRMTWMYFKGQNKGRIHHVDDNYREGFIPVQFDQPAIPVHHPSGQQGHR